MPGVSPGCNFLGTKAVEPHQPIRLIQTVFAHQRRLDQRQQNRGIGDRRKGRVVYPAQFISGLKPGGAGQNGYIICAIRANNHLRALPGKGKPRGLFTGMRHLFCGLAFQPHLRHRGANGFGAFSASRNVFAQNG